MKPAVVAEKTPTTLLTDQMNPLRDRFQSFCLLPLLGLPHHSTQRIPPPDFEITFQLSSFLRAYSYISFYSIGGDGVDEYETADCYVLFQTSCKKMSPICSSFESCYIPRYIAYAGVFNIDHLHYFHCSDTNWLVQWSSKTKKSFLWKN